MEKLIKSLEQLKLFSEHSGSSGGADAAQKKKECRLHLTHLTDLMCGPALHGHKDFVNYIGPSLVTLIQLCDSPDSNVRLASDEALYKVIKALLLLHSNRVLLELCKQIKKNGSSARILKLSMNRFGDLCHYTRPQKRRAYLANLLNAISTIACRKEEVLHESLSVFVHKLFTVMGVFAYENETKTLLKIFMGNLSSESAIVRRCAASAISSIITNNRKMIVMLLLVVNYLTDQIKLSEDNQPAPTPVVTGTLLTLKLLLPLFPTEPSDFKEMTEATPSKTVPSSNFVPFERIVQIFELCLHHSLSADHNVVNAALEVLQQLLKKRLIVTAAALRASLGSQTQLPGASLATTCGNQWNLAPLPAAEESHLLETEVALPAFETFDSAAGDLLDGQFLHDLTSQELAQTAYVPDGGGGAENLEEERVTIPEQVAEAEPAASNSQTGVDIGTLRDGGNPLIYCGRHLAHHFLLTEDKGVLKSDRLVRVSVKNLALNCLTLVGALEPELWNVRLSKSPAAEPSVAVVDVLDYGGHGDPQLRGQAALLACSILRCQAKEFAVSSVSPQRLVAQLNDTLDDKETAACRLAVQGLQQCLPHVLESRLCLELAGSLNRLLTLAANSYWLVRVDLLETLATLSWISLQHATTTVDAAFNATMFQNAVIDKIVYPLICDEDHRVRSAVASCVVALVRTWADAESSAASVRVQRLSGGGGGAEDAACGDLRTPTVSGVAVPVSGLAECFQDVERDERLTPTLTFFVDQLLQWLATSNSKFTKMGCIQSLVTLSSTYLPSAYPDAYGCDSSASCSLLKLAATLMSSSNYMLDLPTHQSLLILTSQLFTGCVKVGLNSSLRNCNRDAKEFRVLGAEAAAAASGLLAHIFRLLNVFCCVVEDLNPHAGVAKSPLVTLPSPSALSPIRRKSKTGPQQADGAGSDKDDKVEDSGRKWNRPIQLLNPANLGAFYPIQLYMKLFDLLKATHATCRLNFDTATSERLSGFLQATLQTLAVILEVSAFQDIAKHSEELLNYLRLVIVHEPGPCLHGVQQLLKCLFGVNLAALWYDEATRSKPDGQSKATPSGDRNDSSRWATSFYNQCGLADRRPAPSGLSRAARRQVNVITKFRAVSKLGPDRTALGSYIRLFEPMVVKALKLYTITSSVDVQKHVLDLLCELIHLCVNYCMLDAEQVFLNFVIQQFEFLEEGFIPRIEMLLPSMFRFLLLLSYDRFHSKTIITVPGIMQLSGGLMATGKDATVHVLPTLAPIVEDLFLSKERMNDSGKELETQKEVLISMLLRLIHHHRVHPLLSAILTQAQAESTAKNKWLSRQICEVLVPHLYKRTVDLDSLDALAALDNLVSHLEPSTVQESLFGLMQTLARSESDDSAVRQHGFHRILASRLVVVNVMMAIFDEPFLLDCLNDLNLSYFVNQSSDPLSVIAGESIPPEGILASLLVGTLKSALNQLSLEQADVRTAPLSQWRLDDSSFLARLLFQYIAVTKTWKEADDFPKIKSAVRAALAADDCRSVVNRLAHTVAWYNPLIFIRICDLLADVDDPSGPLPVPCGGLNREVANKGLFLVACKALGDRPDLLVAFLRTQLQRILLDGRDSAVRHLIGCALINQLLLDELLDFCLDRPRVEQKIENTLTLIELLETGLTGAAGHRRLLLRVVVRLRVLSVGFVHKKLGQLCHRALQLWPPAVGEDDVLWNGSVDRNHSKFYPESFHQVASPLQSLDLRKGTIDKAFVLQFALSKKFNADDWRRMIDHLDVDDLDQIAANGQLIDCILGSYGRCRAELYRHAMELFLRRVARAESLNDEAEMLWAAGAVRSLLASGGRAELDAEEARTLTDLALRFAAETSRWRSTSLALLRAAGCVVGLLPDAGRRWSQPRHLALVYRAVDALVDLVTALRNGQSPPRLAVTGFEKTDLDPAYVRCASNLARLVVLLERSPDEIPSAFRHDFHSVVVALSRTPLFYAYVLVPPSVWEKSDWSPRFGLNLGQDQVLLRLQLPVVPSEYLHDELTLREFIFRIEKFCWNSRPKFEEIWMSILGILNLNNEVQIRPEEQACVVQATCEAVRTLTMVMCKNLPFYGDNSLVDDDAHLPVWDLAPIERGPKLMEIHGLLGRESRRPVHVSATKASRKVFASFRHVRRNLSPVRGDAAGVAAAAVEDDETLVDIQSCLHFLVDLYTQWLQNSGTPYVLLVEIFRSLVDVSDLFADVQHFDWLLEHALAVQKETAADDPPCLESSLVACIFKAAAFVSETDSDTWEVIRKILETSLSSQNMGTRASALQGLLYLLQRFAATPEPNRIVTVVGTTMDYAAKYLGSEQVGPDWHHLLLWSLAFYCGEHFAELSFKSGSVVDYVVQSALNAVLDPSKMPTELQLHVLRGLERLCLAARLSFNLRRPVKKEIINVIRTIDRDTMVFEGSLKTLLALVYTDDVSQLPQPDPETMLMALEWVGVLFHRMKRGCDLEVDLLSRLLPVVTSDIFQPADILNRLLAEFMSATRPSVAIRLTPTIFQVFTLARCQGQQPLVLEWILMILANFNRMSAAELAVATWNHLCFFTAASDNPWLRSVFPFVSRPVDEEDAVEVAIFVAAALDFGSQLDAKQRQTLASVVASAGAKSRCFAAVDAVLSAGQD